VDDAGLTAIHHRSHVAFFRALGERGSADARWVSWPDVGAAIVPASSERSLPNSVLYEDPAALLEHHEAIAAVYAEAGVRAFTVWVEPEDEAALAPELEARGHVRDTAPVVQAAVLADLDLERLAAGELDPDPAPRFTTLGTLNDRAWGLTPPALGAAFSGLDGAPGTQVWITRLGGRPASGLMLLREGDDAYVSMVATAPEAAGRRLGRRLLARALLAARADGCTTSTLEASAAGEPIYAAMGYRTLRRLPMYERRERTAA
jgi:ribosomal protein S18 acetylase RimI-like enzyme